MIRITALRKISVAAALGFIAIFFALAIPAFAQDQGHFVISLRQEHILRCNVDASNCFNIVGSSHASLDPTGGDQEVAAASESSISQTGTIAFTAVFGPDATCVVGGQGICRNHVFLMDADGTNVRQITFNPANPTDAAHFGGDNYASISPDGSMVAFVATRNAAVDGSYASAVYVVNSDGSGLQQVTPFAYDASNARHGSMLSVAWSPDSTMLAFKGTGYGRECGTFMGQDIDYLAVWTINVDGTGQTLLACDNVNAAGGAFAIDWSPDGTLIADARDSIHFGEPAIRITDLLGLDRFSNGLTTAQLGPQAGFGGEICPTDGHCIHFYPDGTRIAYEHNSPNDHPGFSGISTINLDGTGRTDAANFASFFGSNNVGTSGMWWEAGAPLPPAAQITMVPNPIEVWAGFSQQITPSLLDASGSLIFDAAKTFNINYVYGHNCGIRIGPYGLVMFNGFNGLPDLDGSTITAGNEGVASVGVPFKCWHSSPCTYSLDASSQNFTADGGAGSVTITTNPGTTGSRCPWGPASSDPWITISSGSSGGGNGVVSFNVAPNTGAARQGTITIGGSAVLTINQAQQ